MRATLGALAPGGNPNDLITSLAAEFKDPARFIGIHFFSPVDRMGLVEIIRHFIDHRVDVVRRRVVRDLDEERHVGVGAAEPARLRLV